MLVLNNPGIRLLPGGIVYNGVALEVFHGQLLGFKPDAAVFQRAQAIAKEFIDAAGIDNFRRNVGLLPDQIEIIGVQPHLYPFQHFLHHGGIAAHGDALVTVIEIIVVIRKSAGQALDDKRRQLLAIPAPLLFRIVLHQLGIHIGAHQAQRLFFQVLGLCDVQRRHLLRNLRLGLGRSPDAPHLREGVHIEGQIVQLVLIDRHGAVDIIVEFRKLIDIIPHFFVAGVEDVGTIFVDVDSGNVLRIDVSGNVLPAINHQATLPSAGHFSGKHSAIQSGTYNQVVVHILNLSFLTRYVQLYFIL